MNNEAVFFIVGIIIVFKIIYFLHPFILKKIILRNRNGFPFNQRLMLCKKDANGETNKMYLFNPNFITDYKGIS
jgi:hypothetical protein